MVTYRKVYKKMGEMDVQINCHNFSKFVIINKQWQKLGARKKRKIISSNPENAEKI